ncbi:P-loop containing nucleoside triphosphate hydrolase protein [Meredithblackwellia eburnea MCA 4105]
MLVIRVNDTNTNTNDDIIIAYNRILTLNKSSTTSTSLAWLSLAPLLFLLIASILSFIVPRFTTKISAKSTSFTYWQQVLLDPFITEDDILSTPAINLTDTGTHDDEDNQAPPRPLIVQPHPPLSLKLLPATQSVAWASVLLKNWLHLPPSSPLLALLIEPNIYVPFSIFLTWLTITTTELVAPSHLPPYKHLITIILLLSISLITLAQSLHSHLESRIPELGWKSLLAAWSRAPDVAVCVFLVVRIVQMPLMAQIRFQTKSLDNEGRPPSPEDTNTLVGSLTYSWMQPIMTLASQRPLNFFDVWALSLNNRSEVLSKKFKSLTEKSLRNRMLHASARDIAIDFTLKLVAVTFSYLRPYFIQRLLESLTLASSSDKTSISPSNPTPSWSPRSQAYIYACFAFLSMTGRTLAEQQHFHHARRIGMRLRSEITVAVFEKVLRRKDMGGRTGAGSTASGAGKEEGKAGETDSQASAGKVVTLVSDDTDRVLRMGCDAHLIYGTPLELILSLFFLYNLMGWSAFVGFSILAITVPINFNLGKRAIEISRRRSSARDARQGALQELLGAIRTVKFFGWTDAWIAKTEARRSEELRWMIQEWINSLYMTLLWSFINAVVPISAFWCYTRLQQQELTVAVAFTALSLFTMVRGPLNQIPEWGIRILQTNVSIQRMESFLQEDDVAIHASPDYRFKYGATLGFENVTAHWSQPLESRQEPFTLQNLDFMFPEGLSIVTGKTGSGKTSLLLTLLGELEVQGTVHLPRAVSYAAQHPWLESSSVRDNILFGHHFIRERYTAVLEACALLPDLAVLASGDMTFVGERGISLSGGQKARIALARALYAPTKYILLDDVFSAVDSHTARHLTQTLQGPLLRGRTCVLVTHHVKLVAPLASFQIHLEHGRVISQQFSTASRITNESDPSTPMHETEDDDETDTPVGAEAEGWETGGVKGSIYFTYLRASTWSFWSIFLLLLVCRPAFSFLEQYWLRIWGEAPDNNATNYYLGIYAGITFSSMLLIMASTAVLYVASYHASRKIFTNLVQTVIHAPIRWFDVTPVGRIIGRFTHDVSTLDNGIAGNFSNLATHLLFMSTALVVTMVILPATLAPIILFASIYLTLFTRYLSVNRDINRIGATSSSPLFSAFHQAVSGISTIRAFGKEQEFRASLCRILDDNLALWYCSCTLDVWLSIRTQLLSSFCLLLTAVFAVYSRVSPGLAGIAITSSQAIIQSLDWLCNAYRHLVVGLNSLERITEYLVLPQEPAEGIIPPAIWPSSSGSCMVSVEDLEIRYSQDLPAVLHGVSFQVKPGERIAIAGRTGSGKSTLAQSLLRFVEPSRGTIRIDGLDITKISIEELRRRITFLPQDAILFSGSVRDNLDPLSEHTDDECLDALFRVHLITPHNTATRVPTASIDSLDTSQGSLKASHGPRIIGLDTVVAPGGHNFSSGQRQLVALARALLRDSRIIIFDESTAQIDHELDSLIQNTIRTEFPDATLFTIAHRLRTIIDYNRVMVLQNGKIVEFDNPGRLLSSDDSLFHEMCRQSGEYGDLVAQVKQ